MNRRDAIAALVALPEITRISTAPVKPDDVIVIEYDGDGALSMEMAERIRATIEGVWPGRKCVVLGDGLKLKVVGSSLPVVRA